VKKRKKTLNLYYSITGSHYR